MFASSAYAVSQPVHRFDAPLAAGDPREVCRAGTVFVQAGDGVHDFLADQRAGDVVAVATDPRDAGGVREVQVPGIGAQTERRMIRPYP